MRFRTPALALLLAASCSGGGSKDAGPLPLLADRTAGSGLEGFTSVCGSEERTLIADANGQGPCLLDFDGDGVLDLFLPQGATHEAPEAGRSVLFRGRGDGRFEQVAGAAGLDLPGWWSAAAAADPDGDGDTDLYLCGLGQDVLFRNDAGRFTPVARPAGGASWTAGAVWADLTGDAAPDLFLVRYAELGAWPDPLPRGSIQDLPCGWKGHEVFCGPHGLVALPDVLLEGDGALGLADVTSRSGLADVAAGFGLAACPLDGNGDGATDLYVANDSTPNHLFFRDGSRLVEVAARAGVLGSEGGMAQAGMGVAAADLDGDGLIDLAVTNFSDEPTELYRGLGDGRFRATTWISGIGPGTLGLLSWGIVALDLDADGDLDLVQANGHVFPQADEPDTGTTYRQPTLVVLNDGSGRFSATEGLDWAREPVLGRGLALGDLDADGAPDLVLTTLDGPPRILMGRPAPGRTVLRLTGAAPHRDAVGARVVLDDGAAAPQTREVRLQDSYAASREGALFFTLGAAARGTVRWPNGGEEPIGPLEPGWAYVLEEGRGVVGRRPLGGEPGQ